MSDRDEHIISHWFRPSMRTEHHKMQNLFLSPLFSSFKHADGRWLMTYLKFSFIFKAFNVYFCIIVWYEVNDKPYFKIKHCPHLLISWWSHLKALGHQSATLKQSTDTHKMHKSTASIGWCTQTIHHTLHVNRGI